MIKINADGNGVKTDSSHGSGGSPREDLRGTEGGGPKNRPVRAMVVGILNGKIHLYQFLRRKGLRKNGQ